MSSVLKCSSEVIGPAAAKDQLDYVKCAAKWVVMSILHIFTYNTNQANGRKGTFLIIKIVPA